MKLILGLGNPGAAYSGTRHNVGYAVVDVLAAQFHIALREKYKIAEVGTGIVDSFEVLLAKPLTWMNLSGEAADFLLKDASLTKEDLIVVHDDLDLDLGTLRWAFGAGDGGHNGIKSILDHVGDKGFVRLRCGIGRPMKGMNPADYVLQRFSPEEEKAKEAMMATAAVSVQEFLQYGLQWVQQKYHSETK